MMIFANSTVILMCVIRKNYSLPYFRRTLGLLDREYVDYPGEFLIYA